MTSENLRSPAGSYTGDARTSGSTRSKAARGHIPRGLEQFAGSSPTRATSIGPCTAFAHRRVHRTQRVVSPGRRSLRVAGRGPRGICV